MALTSTPGSCDLLPGDRESEFERTVWSRGYHAYRNDPWETIYVGQKIMIMRQSENTHDPYACSVNINSKSRLTGRTITVGHIPRELSRFFWFFIKRGGSINGFVKSVAHRKSPIAEGGLEVPLKLAF